MSFKIFKYRIYPNKEQKTSLSCSFGNCRFVYNHFLEIRSITYKTTGKGLSYFDTNNMLVPLKEKYPWLKSSYSQVLQQKLKDLDAAYRNFFNKIAKYPKFKSKHSKQSIRYVQHFKINSNKLYLPKIGWIRIVLHRPLKGKIKNVTITKTKSGNYFSSFQCEFCDFDRVSKCTGQDVGVDFGFKNFIVLSTGEVIHNPEYAHSARKRLNTLHRKLSRKKKGSKNREKCRLQLVKLYEQIANRRLDFLHKLSTGFVEKYKVICVEDISLRKFSENRNFSKKVADFGWGTFLKLLEYKANCGGVEFIKIDRYYPSSQLCSFCGYRNKELTLKDRIWGCPSCGTFLDRDVNAALNILKFGTEGASG